MPTLVHKMILYILLTLQYHVKSIISRGGLKYKHTGNLQSYSQVTYLPLSHLGKLYNHYIYTLCTQYITATGPFRM